MLRLVILFASLLLAGLALAEVTEHRLDCLLNEPSINQKECIHRGCLWTPAPPRTPSCYLNTNTIGYHLKSGSLNAKSPNHLEATLEIKPEASKSILFLQVKNLQLDINYLSENILRIRITDPATKRYEVPIQNDFNIPKGGSPSQAKYAVTVEDGLLGFKLIVSRNESGAKIIDTSLGGLIYGEHFLQFVTKLATEDVYGIGESYRTTFRHDLNYKTYPLYAHGRPIGEKERNEYGVHPFYQVVEADGKAHGVLLLNSNAMAFTMLPTPAISIKALGGILDFFVFIGEHPEHVTQLYTSVIGRPVMPPFWGLGFQLCRYGYKNLDQVRKVVERNLKNDFPIDVKYLDIDYMDEHRDFTYDPVNFKGLPEYIKETKEKHNFRWTFIVDPIIQGDKPGYKPFDEGYKRDVFIKWPATVPPSARTKPGKAPADKGVMYGKMWPPGPAAFPDFFRNATAQWWIDSHKDFHQLLPFDAIWIDMNEPCNFGSEFLKCPKDSRAIALPSQNLDNLEGGLFCVGAVQGDQGQYSHYDVHSLYALSETKPTLEAVHQATGKRGFVLTRSTYVSSGKYAAHWSGDNFSTWEQLRQSIVGLLEFSLFGMSFVGADICGFNGDTSPELCRRWLQLGAYYPFSRSHNEIGQTDQDPGYFTEIGFPEVTQAGVAAYRVRYQLLHYLYTAFYAAHVHGETVVRPMHHVFPNDPGSRNIDEQFFLGSSILVCPFLYPHQKTVKPYQPHGTFWYLLKDDFVTVNHFGPEGSFYGPTVLTDEESHRPLLLRAGSILPIVSQHRLPKPLNTVSLRKVPVDLWVLPDISGHALGRLFFDDGESIDTIEAGQFNLYEFNLNNCAITINLANASVKAFDSTQTLQLANINVAVHGGTVDAVTLDGGALKWKLTTGRLEIEANLDLLTLKKKTSVIVIKTKGTCIAHH